MKIERLKKVFYIVILTVLVSACSGVSVKKDPAVLYHYTVPEQTRDGWQTAPLSEVHLNESLLSELVQKIINDDYGDIHSILIIKNGKLVLEEYFTGSDYMKSEKTFTRDDLHSVMSVTKSVTSTLIGIAMDKGLIKGADEELVSFFPEYRELLGDNGRKIKLRHVLSMSAGFDWDETTYLYSDSRNPYWEMLGPERENIIRYILSRP